MLASIDPNAEATIAAAEQAAESLREIGHVALTNEPFDMSTLYRVVAMMSLVTQRLPNDLDLVTNHTTRRNRDFVLRHDAGGDVEETITTIVEQLAISARSITGASSAVGGAHNQLGHLADPGTRRES